MLIRNSLRYAPGPPPDPKPVFTSDSAFTFPAGAEYRHTLTTDIPSTFAITGGPDAGECTIDGDELVIATQTYPDTVQVTVQATSTAYGTTQTQNIVGTVAEAGDLVYNWTELNAAIAALAPSYDGVINLAADGDFGTSSTISVQAATMLTIQGPSKANRAVMPTITLNSCDNLTLKYIDASDDTATSGYDFYSNAAGRGYCQNIILDGCKAGGIDLTYLLNDPTPIAVAPSDRQGIGGRFLNNLTVRNCDFENLIEAVKPNQITGHIIVEDNFINNILSDGVSFSGGNDLLSVTVRNNLYGNFISNADDTAGIHSDAIIQMWITGDNNIQKNVVVEGNILYSNCRGHPQAIFLVHSLAELAVGAMFEAAIIGDNLMFVNTDVSKCPGMNIQTGSLVTRNIAARVNPGVSSGFTNAPEVDSVELGAEPYPFVPQPSMLTYSVGESFASSSFGTVLQGNMTLPNVLADYTAAYEGDFTGALPAMDRGAIAAFLRPKSTGPLAALRDVYDFVNGVRLVPLPLITVPPNLTDQPVSTVTTTQYRIVQGGVANMAVVALAGTEWSKATYHDGTGATAYTSSAGTINPGEYISWRFTTAAGGSDSVVYGTTIDGTSFSGIATTASVATFDGVDNQGAAYSTLTPAPVSAPNQKKAIIGLRWRPNDTTISRSAIAAGGGTTLWVFVDGTGRIRFQFAGSAQLRITGPTVDTDWHTDLFAIDFTKTVASEVVTWVRDGVVQTWTGSPSITGTVTFNPSIVFNALTAFSTDAGSGIINGNIEFFIADCGLASYTNIDITDPMVYNMFTADNIGVDGSGPFGHQPLIYVTGDDTAWNVGVANLGSAGGTFNKTAGTYIPST